MTSSDAVPTEAVTPLLRGVGVLERLTGAGGTLSLSALERETGLARSTVDRVVGTLARVGYVRLDGRDASLAPRVAELGNAYLSALRLPSLLGAWADQLADELDESVSLAVGDRDGIRFIHQATRRRTLSLSFRIGDLLPAERTAPGALFASEWDEEGWAAWRARREADPTDSGFVAVPDRELGSGGGGFGGADFVRRADGAGRDGFALDDQLIEPGLVAISVPVRGVGGRIACVASVVSHTSRHPAEGLRDALLPRLREAVAGMEEVLRTASEAVAGPAPAGLAGWTGASKQELGRGFVESLARGLSVLTAFGEGRDALTLSEVARATGLSRASARRALITFRYLGLVQLGADPRQFVLTPRVLGLGFPPLSRTNLARIAQPHLEELASRVQEPVSLGVLVEGGEVQYAARVGARHVMSVELGVGARLPAWVTSSGRVLLADLPSGERELGSLRAFTSRTVTDAGVLRGVLDEVRARGFALVDEELEDGLRSIAVPVRGRDGRALGAVSVSTHVARRSVEECLSVILPELLDVAGRITEEVGVVSRFIRVR
ncbi:IclR family transcriptional regulator domain-containing protein [Streptomyces acidiscabies]|uniref:IclR family transcriptional regulator C-terminal domain-containing protein n=1 Tax=Streptomyces acidiscabies TaxID=42234 RepID=A0AAP6BCW1_9ACTN|nr:IclR family transcriptional regulator C-terminal domain-containing protein [Streptomyces acidiscabies]MBP5938983.1 helix-turn-helix domain-containing protein [Streptomyces sp. LBUM 1476]MBZ3910095.1 helix-turn-helix domain-containing protein [Streptomyces acidiscabies]MDX2962429.1 IclR family transcriptional regulator C-terminal domain-containing protein [Streptomyces acidiscabies]MDX3020327.1 IclR family transcriptional regulator C-terminal domain-containing protein [Streptomyces acidiscabi